MRSESHFQEWKVAFSMGDTIDCKEGLMGFSDHKECGYYKTKNG